MRRGGRAQTVRASLKESTLWSKFATRRLTVNMRVRQLGQSREAEEFAAMLLRWGDGEGSLGFDVDGHRVVELPEAMRVGKESELIDWVVPGIRHTGEVGGAVLCTRNNIVDSINAQVFDIFPGEEHVANSADALAMEDAAAIPVEYLNSQTPSGMPPHALKLKAGMHVMPLCNLDPNEKCNGTRMKVGRSSATCCWRRTRSREGCVRCSSRAYRWSPRTATTPSGGRGASSPSIPPSR